jgi:hypothetical protein
MPSLNEWKTHFSKVPGTKVRAYMKSIDTLRHDPMIGKHYGEDLAMLKILMESTLTAGR